MTDFTILVQNKSGASRAYFLFVKSPVVSGVGADKLFQNVYISAKPVPNQTGTAQFQLHKQFYAVTGTSPSPLAPNVNVSTGDFELITLSDSGNKGSATYMTVDEMGARFQPEKITQSISQPGGYCITTDKSFNYPSSENYFIGLGAQNPLDASHIIPVASFPAQPNTKNIIVPHNTYYIAWGTHTAGDVIDTTTLAEPCEVDFTNTRSNKAKVVHNDNGSWIVTFN